MISLQENSNKQIAWNVTDEHYLHIEGSALNRRLHPLWLRERIQGQSFTESNSKQRLYEPSDLNQEVKIKTFRKNSEDFVEITFSDDASGIFSVNEILNELNLLEINPVPKPIAWDQSILQKMVRFSFPEIQKNDQLQYQMLQFFFTYGFVQMIDVECKEGMVCEFQKFFGPIKETNFGQFFTVKSLKKPSQGLAQTSVALPPHTDLPYKDSMPQIQLLHCLQNEITQGGESILVDGLAISEHLRKEYPDFFKILTQTKVRFVYQEGETIIKQKFAPMIEIDSTGEFVQVRLGTRIEFVPALEPEQLTQFYKARKIFVDLTNDPKFQLCFPFEPGMVSIFNNIRLLHARKQYDATQGSRMLQGCYSDMDPYQERLLLLSQKLQ